MITTYFLHKNNNVGVSLVTNNLLKRLVAVAAVAVIFGYVIALDNEKAASSSCLDAGTECKQFTVLHTNDNHGRFWENKYGEYGMAARKSLIDDIRAEVSAKGGETLLLSGGDINTGVPESDLQDAIPDFIGMNEIKYDAMAVGNHEFDNPLAVLDKQRALAKFPMLAANIYKPDGSRYFEPYKIFNISGLRIAVIGLTTEDTAKLSNPEFTSELTFTHPQTEIKKVIAEIKQANSADLIFAATHMGHYQNGKHGSNAPGDVEMARALSKGELNAVIGGHSQNPVCMESGSNKYKAFKPGDKCRADIQNGTYIMQAHEWGKYVGRADFEYYNGELHLRRYQLIPVNLKTPFGNQQGKYTRVYIGKGIVPDKDLKQLLLPYQTIGKAQLEEKIATTDSFLDGTRDNVRNMQTNLGHLIAEAQRSKVNADIGIMNSGGVRASIEQGDISYRDVLTVQPFGNMITLSEMKGVDITRYLNKVASFQRDSGAYAQIVGIKMTVDCKAKKVNISEINGKKYNPQDTYTFTVPGFNAAGGVGYPIIKPFQTGYVDAEVLYSYFKSKQQIVGADYLIMDDIRYQNSKSPLGCTIN